MVRVRARVWVIVVKVRARVRVIVVRITVKARVGVRVIFGKNFSSPMAFTFTMPI